MNQSVSKTIATSPSPSSLSASSTSSFASLIPLPSTKSTRDPNLWFPFIDYKSEYCKDSVYNYSNRCKSSNSNNSSSNDNQNAAKDLHERETILSELPLATLTPLPSMNQEKKFTPLPPMNQEKKFIPSLYRYFSTPENKHDILSSYSNIVSEVAPPRAASVIPYPTISDIFTPTGQYRSQTPHPSFQQLANNLHANQRQITTRTQSHSKRKSSNSLNIGNNVSSASTTFTPSSLFNSHSYPTLLQNISSYEAAARSSSRCTLPSPTIYPPTPPPSAPWNPWAGF